MSGTNDQQSNFYQTGNKIVNQCTCIYQLSSKTTKPCLHSLTLNFYINKPDTQITHQLRGEFAVRKLL